MNMKFYTVLFMVFIGVMTFGGCTNDTMASSDSSSANGTDPSKITSLQAAVDLARPGDTIDASQYTNITQYEANINKAVTIQNFSNLDGKTLTVSADGVVLSNIGNVGVMTNSSLKISGSSLSSLSIAQSSAQQSLYCGRGDSARTRPPKVELLSSSVSSGVSINIENAALTVNDITTDKIKFNANGTQLTIEDSSSNIGRIETDKICQVVLEDGTSDTIPCSKDKIDVTDDGKLTQINMQAAESLILTKLSPDSGLVTTMKEGETIDFSKLEVIGTYMASGAVTVYTAKLTYNLQSTYTQLEENFTIKIDGNPAYIRTDRVGQNVVGFDWSSLAPGYHQASIESDFGNLGSEYKYNFEITVYEANLTPELIGIEADLRYVRSTNKYLADETLDLSGLKILGEYRVVSSLSGTTTYKEEIEGYTLSIADGAVLTTDMTAVVVSYQGLNTTIPITVSPSCRVTLYYGYKTESYLIENPTTIAEPEVNRPGYWQGKFKSSQTR
ncbi:MAG: hypothetical protein II707_10340, partial [Spirochaetales bacterium]|nr:hypothetical protein [Spirochaetales bacterium]